jgi:hypothetical protein
VSGPWYAYWNTGCVFALVGGIATVGGAFFWLMLGGVNPDCYDKKDNRRAARVATLAPIAGLASLVLWPVVATVAGLWVGKRLYRAAWTEAADDKADRLRRERSDRDREIARLEREAGIR